MIVTILLSIIAGIAVGAGVVFLVFKNKQKAMLANIREKAEAEYAKSVTELKQQFLASVSHEFQEPMSQIITPLQLLDDEKLSDVAKARVQQSLLNAQDLMHRLNMLIDFRYSASSPVNEFKFTLPKQSAPIVVYVPLEKKQEETVAEEEAKSVVEKAETDAGTVTEKDVLPAAEQATAPTQEQKVEPTPEEKAMLLQRLIAESDTKQGSSHLMPAVTVDGVIDDENAADAANKVWESTAAIAASMEGKHKFTMLVVDDAPDMCRFARDYFRGEYNVLTASNGEQALDKLRNDDSIDLVVSDVTMPRMDGFQLCEAIKTDLRWSHIPVILLTGRTAEEMEVQGLKLGADDYITKPFNAETLRLRVKKFIEKKEKRMKDFKENADINPNELTITDVDEQFIRQAIKIVEDNMSNTDFSVEALGAELEMSRTYLYKKLINITGIGPGEFIRTLRLKRGKQLLERGQMQIAEVAAAVGYNTPKRFTENFKIEYEMSPSEYMRKVKAEAGARKFK